MPRIAYSEHCPRALVTSDNGQLSEVVHLPTRGYSDPGVARSGPVISNFETRLVAIGMPADIAATRAVVGLTALQGYLMRYFTATDPAMVDREFLRFVDDVILAPF